MEEEYDIHVFWAGGMVGDTPQAMDLKRFFDKYVRLAPSKLDSYSPGHWMLTQRLEELGSRILTKEASGEASLMLFLIDVSVWKEPFEQPAKAMIATILSNTYAEIASTFNKVREALGKDQDLEAIEAIGSLKGFGRGDGSRKVASAVLRFLDPGRFATVDYRNWVILSNTENRYFPDRLLEPLAPTMEGTRRLPITTQDYLKYLRVVRELAETTHFSPAEIDMALFAFSNEIKPLSRTKVSESVPRTTPPASTKYLKMEAQVVAVINDQKKKGSRRAAETLERYLNNVRRNNPTPAAIMSLCTSLTIRRPEMDMALGARGALTLRHILPELQRIYSEPDG